MKSIRLYVCTILLAVMAVSMTGCSNTNRTVKNPVSETTAATKVPATTATQRATEGVIDGLMDDVKDGATDVKDGLEDVKDDMVGTRATTGPEDVTTETIR